MSFKPFFLFFLILCAPLSSSYGYILQILGGAGLPTQGYLQTSIQISNIALTLSADYGPTYPATFKYSPSPPIKIKEMVMGGGAHIEVYPFKRFPSSINHFSFFNLGASYYLHNIQITNLKNKTTTMEGYIHPAIYFVLGGGGNFIWSGGLTTKVGINLMYHTAGDTNPLLGERKHPYLMPYLYLLFGYTIL